MKALDSIRKRVRRLLWRTFWRREGDILPTRNGLFFLDPGDYDGVSCGLRTNGEYEYDDLLRTKALIRAGSKVLIVGAHIGAFAVPLSKACGALTVVEANPRTFPLLERNLKANGCGNVRALNFAAAEKAGEIEFVFNTANSGGSKRKPVHSDPRYFYDDPEVGKVPCARLDDLLVGEDFDFILMDIEGSETFAFQGMPRLLSKARILMVEFLPHHLERVANVTAAQFLAPLAPNFDRLTIPTKGRTVGRDAMLPELEALCAQRKGDMGLIFSKSV